MTITSANVRAANKRIHTLILMRDHALHPKDGVVFAIDSPLQGQPTIPIEYVPNLCPTCDEALGYFAYWLEQKQSFSGRDKFNLAPSAAHHADINAMMESAANGCPICIHIACNLRSTRDETGDESFFNGHSLEACWSGDFSEQGDPLQSIFQVSVTTKGAERSTATVRSVLQFQFWPLPEYRELCTNPRLYSDRHNHRATDDSDDDHPVRVIQESSGSEESAAMARAWLSHCQGNLDGTHHECNRNVGRWLPGRLLDVRSAIRDSSLKLVSVADVGSLPTEDRTFVTLSHCWGQWGQTNLPVLTSVNKSDRMLHGVPLDRLPQTFRDAVKVADWFQVRWLWIDSLCIMQDQLSDWQHEAADMAKIYGHALINISADSAPDARGGLFNIRFPTIISPHRLEVPSLGRQWIITLGHHELFDWVDEAPLSRRAWVFQERQLARRVLHFTEAELVWECCAKESNFASETFPSGAVLIHSFSAKHKYQHIDVADRYATWTEVCELYSQLSLSYVSDKLVALSGLAKEFASSMPNDQYLAGSWRSTLPSALLWSAVNEVNVRLGPDVAPSWSWASINGHTTIAHSAVKPWSPFHAKSSALLDLVAVEVNGKPCGSSGGSDWTAGDVALIVKGIAREVVIRDISPEGPGPMAGFFHLSNKKHSLDFGGGEALIESGFQFTLDEERLVGEITATILPIEWSEENESRRTGRTRVSCLLLRETKDAGVYKRIGAISIDERDVYSLSHRPKLERVSDDVRETLQLQDAPSIVHNLENLSLNESVPSVQPQEEHWKQLYSRGRPGDRDDSRYERLVAQTLRLV